MASRSTRDLTLLFAQTLRCWSQSSTTLSNLRGRWASTATTAKYKRKDAPVKKRKKQSRQDYKQHDLKEMDQFALCDAMRYIRAFEVGHNPTTSKYELHIRLRTPKNGPAVRSRLMLPHPVDTSARICVICPPDSKHAIAAKQAGAVLVGEEEIFDLIREGKLDFDRCICQAESLEKLNQARLGRILGPKGLMPSNRTGTVVKNAGRAIRDLVGTSDYRERLGVIRLAIGQLAHTPEQLHNNIRDLLASVNANCTSLQETVAKSIHEVVLSSSHAPGFSLNGDFRSPESLPTNALEV